LQTAFTNRALADANGNIILANPAPGTVGSLGRAWIEGPAHVKFDVNLVKRIRIDEAKSFEIRMDVIDILNTPYWNNPVVDINNVSFGRMDAADVTTGASNADNPCRFAAVPLCKGDNAFSPLRRGSAAAGGRGSLTHHLCAQPPRCHE
jgi:hypothetical protein